MLYKRALVIAGMLALVSVPAQAESFDFAKDSAGTTTSSLTYTAGGITVTLDAYTFGNLSPDSLGGFNLTAFTGSALSYSDRGVGVCSAGETGGAQGNSEGCPEIDSADEQGANASNLNEGMLLSFTGVPVVSLLEAVLNRVDDVDTLGIYGVDALGSLTLLGFDGTILGATDGGFTVTAIGSNTNTQHQVTFTPALAGYSRYFFTTTTNGTRPTNGDGYRLRELTVAAVPEPATWAMLLVGFGFIGFQMRGSRRRVALAA